MPPVAALRGLVRGSHQYVERVLVEDPELDRLVAPGDRIGKPVRFRRERIRRPDQLIQRLGDLHTAVVGEHDRIAARCRPRGRAMPHGLRLPAPCRSPQARQACRRLRAAAGARSGSASGSSAAAGRANARPARRRVRDGGSSRFFSSALAALVFMSSAGSTMTIAVAAVMRGQRQEAADAPDLVDGEHGLEPLGLVVDGPRQVQHRGMRAAGDLPVERRGRIPRREGRGALCRPTGCERR